MTTKTKLEEAKQSIREQIEYIDIKPYSDNIISINLQIIAKEYGNDEANKTIEEFSLEKLGWKKKLK